MSRPLKSLLRGPTADIPDESWGNAMQALNPQMREFTFCLVIGGMNQKDAAIAAGYASGDSAKTRGSQLVHRPDVQAAMQELARHLMCAEGANSIRALIRVRDDSRAKHSDVVKAAEALLDRCGLGGISQSHLTVDHNVNLSDAQLDARIITLCKELGLSEATARQMLIDPNVVDAEFTEVTPPTPEQMEHRAALDHENKLRRERQSLTPDQLAERKRQDREARRARGKAKRAALQSDAELEALLAPIQPGEFL